MKTFRKKRGTTTKEFRKKRLLRIGVAVLAIVVIIRLLLPYWILTSVNNRLAGITGYYGHVDDIHLSLLRGAYQVENLSINKEDSITYTLVPFFEAPWTDISIEWKSLFRGKIVSELDLRDPVLRFTEDKVEPKALEKDTNDFRRMLKTFTPLKVNRFEVSGGKIQYIDSTVTPIVDIQLDNAYILARNLSNVRDTALLPAKVDANANVYGGSLDFKMRLDALAEHPTFDLNAEIKSADLTRLNDFFKAYADFDVNKGTFGLYMEFAAKDRKFIGYVKPFIKDLDVVGPEDRKDNLLRKIWEGLVGIVGDVLDNPETDRIATKIPIVGEYGDQTIGIWYAVLAAVHNGFIQAIYPSLDYQVSIGSINAVDPKEEKKGSIFKKVFGKPTDQPKDKTKKKD